MRPCRCCSVRCSSSEGDCVSSRPYYLPIPKKLAQSGVKDMVRTSDARMSGTAFGTIVLHVSPDASSGGPLAPARVGARLNVTGGAR